MATTVYSNSIWNTNLLSSYGASHQYTPPFRELQSTVPHFAQLSTVPSLSIQHQSSVLPSVQSTLPMYATQPLSTVPQYYSLSTVPMLSHPDVSQIDQQVSIPLPNF